MKNILVERMGPSKYHFHLFFAIRVINTPMWVTIMNMTMFLAKLSRESGNCLVI